MGDKIVYKVIDYVEHNLEWEADECKKLGARDYIVKPFDEEQITETVQKFLGEQALTSSE